MLDHIVKELCDFRTIAIPEKMLEIKISSKTIENGLEEAAARFLTIHAAEDGIRPGDIVALELGGEIIRVNVGRGLTDKALEQELIGKKVGSALQGGGEIISVKRRCIPELTDELVCRLEIDGVSTVADYRDYLFCKAVDGEKRRKLHGISGYLKKELLERSAFYELPKNHPLVEQLYSSYRSRVEEAARQQGKTAWEIAAQFFGLKKRDTEEEQWDELRSETIKTICVTAIGWCLAQQDNVTFDGEGALEAYYNYLEEKIQTCCQDKFQVSEV